jgi:hypothetical protein
MQSLVAQVLAAWRHAEHLTETLAPDTPEYAAATKACADLRATFQDLTDAGMASLVDDRSTVDDAKAEDHPPPTA